MYIFLISAAAALAAVSVGMYMHTSKILKSLDEMLTHAVNGDFYEETFDEGRLSRLETKMHRYLSAGKTARNQLLAERNSIKELVSDISHQTKTPLSNIMLYTELLSENPSIDGSARGMIYQVREQTDKLRFLIQALVKVSRLENGIVAVTPSENSIRLLLEHIDCTAGAKEKNIRLVTEEIPDITAVFDLKWTAEAVANIIENAVKYTSAGGTVKISAAEYEMFVKIDIADTGIGMTEDETAKIFTRFYRSPSVAAEKGVGIGLYLSREILSQEGGYIKVNSELGKGSVFSVFLPKSANLSKL